MFWFGCYNTKKSKKDDTLLKIISTMAIFQKQVEYYENERNDIKRKINDMIEMGMTADSKRLCISVKRLDETISKLYSQLNILEANKLSFIEEQNNRVVFDLVTKINKEHMKSDVKMVDLEKELEKNLEVVEERKEVAMVLEETFVEENELDVSLIMEDMSDEFRSDEITLYDIKRFDATKDQKGKMMHEHRML